MTKNWLGACCVAVLFAGVTACEEDKKEADKTLPTGSPCDVSSECTGGDKAVCLDNASFRQLVEEDVNIPDGYCSRLGCVTNKGDEECGEGAYCFDLQQYVEQPLGACFKVCQSGTDCRPGYDCMDGAGGEFQPLPFKACLPPELTCLLSIPHPSCPAPDGGDDGAADDGAGGDPIGGDPQLGDN
ncbi:MAG: hypothetical protein A2289_25785 [Deltaproteobacteria bacterium RIFOXYA12_FULL_58_15]|nr:MAG: hypothetical protein A2289_25785 [Deltaproteobacteria bacterium RIFOXYA12_FULL_58_15]OGR11227.1 MAG: hypothetical protein A2341_24925 [Deltaproteobacteria bacterium RIFOXYB12_FULL_58_9]